ncbi:N-6 DNA methylase, partial [candidate division KSB1 bacterium]|nr:N-6 DNA methylase [candidate division KSB1 bacterium]
VVHEDAIKVGQATKAPDYSFRVGGVRKFFLEAKKPSVDIKKEIHPAYQLRRYAWSARLPLSILTDFEEFAVYDCRVKPTKTDKASTARIFYLTFDEYQQRWEEIADIFSREAILKGSFDKYVESTRAKKGTAEVDAAFLQEIERWRDFLARNIALRNTNLTQKELNFAVQRTIDRIIFLRICGDRGIEPYRNLMALLNGTQVYPRLCQLFYRADDRYNSGLFHFKQEKNRSEDSCDTLTTELNIDDKILKDIIKNLYYPDSPYEFSVLPADILGQVYEQFLGKIISLTAGHRAKVEYKPEVRKAGGVYYTPTYIVDYIVKNTVGKLVEGKKPGPKSAVSKLKILDPACGSGSFLLGAYQFLLDWHRDEYIKDDPEKWVKGRTPQLYQNDSGEWKLTTDESKRILLDNIYGVDIDAQAVEVTKLSLLLKVLEGENQQTIQQQFALFQKRVLPDLGNNIKCGNSLISTDFYQGRQTDLLNEEEMYRVNAFDWEKEFAEIMEDGGFDAVIGNPPWIDIKGMDPVEVDYYFFKYSTTHNRMNVYSTFLHRSTNLIKENGFLGYITPSSFYTQSSYEKLRKYLLKISTPISIIRMPDGTFEGVTAESAITIFSKSNQKKCQIAIYKNDDKIFAIDFKNASSFKTSTINAWKNSEDYRFNIYIADEEYELVEKIESKKTKLIDICDFSLGLTPYDKYKGHNQYQIKNKIFHSNYKKDDTFKHLLSGAGIERYLIKWDEEKWISYGDWLGAPREQKFFTDNRILVRQIISGIPPRIYAGITHEEYYNAQIAFNLLLKHNCKISLHFILGIINSSLITYYHKCRYLDQSKKTFQKILIQDAKKFPIFCPTKNIDHDKSNHDQIVTLVEQMLNLHKQLSETKLPQSKTTIKRQIETTDREIDRLVYELYDLTDEEIKIVEDCFKK